MEVMILREHRERAALSTRELAERAGIAAKTIWNIEGGQSKRVQPRIKRAIADVLGVHPSEIAEFAPKPAEKG